MEIHGLQKMTLLDYPGKVACTVFLSGCDFRCPFCHNGELVTGTCPPETDDQGLLAFLNRRKGLLDGVCVTGGEPLLRPDLPLLLGEIKELGFRVKVDTNGTHPDRLRRLVEEGLVDYVAMDVKNSPERYGETAGVYGLELASVRDSVSYLLSGAVDYEFRTTVVRGLHTSDDFRQIGPWIKGCPEYYLQCFTESGEVLVPGVYSDFTKDEMTAFADLVRPYVGQVSLRGIDY